MLLKRADATVVWHQSAVTRTDRERRNGHRSVLLWFTGLPSAGKSTLSHAVEDRLHREGRRTIVLDGDNVRHGLCSDLGFSETDRSENLRRIGEMSKLFLDAGIITLAAFVSPSAADRAFVRDMVPPGDFVEIYCDCSLDVCEQRDVKGMYRRARAGAIRNFTGVDGSYEAPANPDLVIDTANQTLQESVAMVMEFLVDQGKLNLGDAGHQAG
jgi:adenylylsulfate kinase